MKYKQYLVANFALFVYKSALYHPKQVDLLQYAL